MTKEFAFETARLSAQNLNDMARLYQMVYGSVKSADYFIKKYSTEYTGVSYVGYIAYNEADLPIAYYGVIPCFLSINKSKVLAAQSADTMTHPRYQKQGLYRELMNLTIALCREENIQLLYGFPNQNSVKGRIRGGWQIAEYMDCFIIKTKGAFGIRLLRKLPALKRIYARYVSVVFKPWLTDRTGLAATLIDEGFDTVLRNEAYLKTKTISPTLVLNIGGALIWLKLQNGLTIGDMKVNDNAFETTIKSLKNIARKLGLNQVMFQTSPGTRLYHLFAKRHPSFQTFPVTIYPLSPGIDTNNLKFTFADIDIF